MNTIAKNTELSNGAAITWTQYPTKAARQGGRTRTGLFWSLAPGSGAIWVKPDTPEPGEAVAVKVYRKLSRATAEFQAVAYDDDLVAATP